jgi:hypothetical protein
MKNTVDYTFDDYPNVQVLAYRGADGTYETDLDKILSDLVVGKNKYGHIHNNVSKLYKTLFSCFLHVLY